MDEIPLDVVINFDQTGINYIPVSSWTMEVEGAKRVEVAGKDDKRQITAIFVGSMTAWRRFATTMDDIPYSLIRVIYVLRPCAVGFTVRNIRDIFLRKWALVVFNISVACHNFKTTVQSYSVTRRMPSIAIFASLILSVSSRVLVKSSFRAPIFYLES